MIDQGRAHMPLNIRHDDDLILNEVDNILGSPSTELFATWARDTNPPSPRLWHNNRIRGTVVTTQLRGPDRRGHDVRCVTYLDTTMHAHRDR